MDNNEEIRQVHKVPVQKKKKPINVKVIVGIVIVIAVIIVCAVAFKTTKDDEDKYTSTVTNGDKEVITGAFTMTKQGYYEKLLENNGASEVVSEAYTKIADKELTSKADKESIKTEQTTLENNYKSYMGSVSAYATSMGYDSEADFRKYSLIPTAKQNALLKKYLNKNYKKVLSTYKVSYIKYFTFEKESQALKAIKSIKSESDYTTQASASSTSNDLGLLTSKTSGADSALKKKAGTFAKMTKDGVYSNAVKLSGGTYAVVYVYNTDKDKVKDSTISSLADIDDIKEDVTAYYLNKHDFTVYDEKLKKEIKKINKKYIKD